MEENVGTIEYISIILLINILFYLKTLGYKYCSDDHVVYFNPPQMNNKLTKLLYWIEGRYKHHPQYDHALTMFIHAFVCVGIYLAFGANNISFIASILFSINPCNTQASVWTAGRSYALSALGIVYALAFPYLSLIPIILATYYNQGFVSSIILAFSATPLIAIFLPVSWAIHYRRFKFNVTHKINMEMLAEDKALKFEKIPLVIKTFGFYTTLAIIPFNNAFYHSFLQSVSGSGLKKAYSFRDRFFWLGLVYSISILYYWITNPWNQISFCLLWWIICISPFLNLFRMNQEIAERYMYLPSIGLMVVLSTLFIDNQPVISAFIAMYATRTWFSMDMYQDDYYLHEHSCLDDPSAWFAWHSKGMQRWNNGSFQEAVVIWTMARILSPKEFKVNFNLATALKLSGHSDEANKFMDIAEKCIPNGQEVIVSKYISDWKAGKVCVIL